MANNNVPGKPRIVSISGNEVRVEWVTPARNGYLWNVYAGVAGTGSPLPGPVLNSAPLPTQTFRFNLEDVLGNSPPANDLEIAVTSVLQLNGEESGQGPLLEINVDAGDPAKPNHPTVGRAPDGSPTYLATDEDGELIVSVSAALPPGASTEAKQDAGNASLVSIDGGIPAALGQALMAASLPVTLASDQGPVNILDLLASSPGPVSIPVPPAASVPIPAVPLVGRKMFLAINVGTTDCLLGVGGVNVWPMIMNQVFIIGAGPSLAFTVQRATGAGAVVIWELA